MNGCWTTPESLPNLVSDQLQLWRIDLGTASAPLSEIQFLLHQAYAVLNTAERERAARMRAGATREEFVAGRGCLRRLLGSVLDADPRTLILETSPNGKPFLRPNAGEVLPEFNLAHSRGVILIALSTVGPIGVDVEYLDPGVELDDLARTAFHPDEIGQIQLVATQEERLDVFYRCWTRKEAIVKADGRGLTLEPTSFAAGMDSNGEQKVILKEPISEISFYVRGIDVGSSHRAALATTARGLIPKWYVFSPQSPLLYDE
jgi:4'-phosphopantetheinyl transferase